jgi:hypothetical protein
MTERRSGRPRSERIIDEEIDRYVALPVSGVRDMKN